MCLWYLDLHQTFILNIQLSTVVTSFLERFFCVSITFMGNLCLYSRRRGDHPGHSYFLLQYCNKNIHEVPDRSCFMYQKAQNICASLYSPPTLCYFSLFWLLSSNHADITFAFVLRPTASHLNPRIYLIVFLLHALQPPLFCSIVNTLTCYLSHTLMSSNSFPSPVSQHPATVFKPHSLLTTQKT